MGRYKPVEVVRNHINYVQKTVPVGTHKDDIRSLLGGPHNFDSDVVWIWSSDFNGKKESWKTISKNSPSGGVYVLFKGDYSATSLLTLSAYEIEYMLEEIRKKGKRVSPEKGSALTF
jgi:hypothetical protein